MYAIRVNTNTTNQVQSRTQPVRSDSDLIGFFVGQSIMKRIPLTRDKFAIVDDEDYEYLMQWKWQARKGRGTYYAVRTEHLPNGGRQRFRMHRVILDAPQNKQVDHRNHNGLDNRKCNLRLCTNSDNQHNRRPMPNYSSIFKSVHRHRNKWAVSITNNYKNIYVGVYDTEIAAAKAYDKKARKLFGEFACVNFATHEEAKQWGVQELMVWEVK